MSTKIFFLNSDDANYGEEELNYVQTFFFEEGVLNTQGADWEDWVDNGDLLVEQRAAGANMSVDVGIGNAIVETTRSGVTFKAFVFSTAVENKTVPANSSGANRVDAVILRVDRDTDPNALMNNIATVEYITGTNGATAMSDGQIQTALGDDDDFIRLADVTVEDSETQILDADISDERVRAVSNDAITQSPTVLRFRSVATNPATANLTEGEMWFNSTDKEFKYYDGTQILVVDETLLPIAGEKNALAGNDGTPDTGNKYVTQTGLQKGAEIYAADAEADDTYVITLSPVPSAYTTGMVIYFKANTANTGACTLNVNTLGAKTIKKNAGDDLETGDIESGQICTVIYDGTNFQILSNILNPKFANGTETRAGDTASGDQVIAHGLGVVPKFIRISVLKSAASMWLLSSVGVYNKVTTSCVASEYRYNTTPVAIARTVEIVYLLETGVGSQTATIAVDATNITLTWTKTNNPTSPDKNIMWEAYA